MESAIINPKIEVCKIENNNCLRFSFKGSLEEEDAKNAIIEWKRVFKSNDGEKFILVWDCNQMTGYNPGARIIWQNALIDFKDQITGIWVVSKSTMIRSAAMIISMITKYDIKVVRNESKISLS